jgi:hypothetical protein
LSFPARNNEPNDLEGSSESSLASGIASRQQFAIILLMPLPSH